ncbi:MAG: beta-ketoacyl-ACP synthase III [Anaerolineae bacterium]|nr:beta-ketoacyl-ACP synthase III [Anaerolineae bacterium]
METAYITGWGVCMPNNPVSNREIENVLGKIDGRTSPVKDLILERNGIKFRYYAIDPATGKQTHNNTALTAEAIREMARSSGFSLEEIECLACGTSSPDQIIPNHACMVHGELGNPPCEVVATSGVCCSGMTALKYGFMNVAAGLVNNAIVTGSELASAHLRASHFNAEVKAKKGFKDVVKQVKNQLSQIDSFESAKQRLKELPYIAFENEFLRWMLSDGAGALLITNKPREDRFSLRVDWMEVVSYANELEPCMYWGAVKQENGDFTTWRQNGQDTETLLRDGFFNLTQDVRVLADNIIEVGFQKSFKRVQEKHQGTPDAIDWLLPHYSSDFFRQPIYDKLVENDFVIPYEKWFTNLPYKGNTGSASIYIMLEELMNSGRVKEGDTILCAVPESARFSFAYMHLTVV